MKEFVLENLRLVILVCCLILHLCLEIIISLLGTKKSGKNEPFYRVVEKLPSLICLAESEGLDGEHKKKMVLSNALDFYERLTGIRLGGDSKIAMWISQAIEKILLTPQKKGVNDDEEK